MKRGVFGVLLGILVAGAVGFWIGRTQGGPPMAARACAGTAAVEYDAAAKRITVIGNSAEPKALLVEFPDLSTNAPDVCWDFRFVNGSARFTKLRIDTKPPVGSDGRTPLLVGDANFQGGAQNKAALRYSGARPNWSKVKVNGAEVDGVKWGFSVTAELQDGGTVSFDPDIIIIKDRPRSH